MLLLRSSSCSASLLASSISRSRFLHPVRRPVSPKRPHDKALGIPQIVVALPTRLRPSGPPSRERVPVAIFYSPVLRVRRPRTQRPTLEAIRVPKRRIGLRHSHRSNGLHEPAEGALLELLPAALG